MTPKKVLVPLLYLLFSGIIHAQAQPIHTVDFRFDRLATEDGLSHVTVNTILQDQFGRMWIGTTDGLNLYDGSTFQVFRASFQENNKLQSSVIKDLYEDEAGIIWIGTYEGLAAYDFSREAFKSWPKPENSFRIYKILPGENGELLLGTNAGIYSFDRATGAFRSQENTVGWLVSDLLIDGQNTLWAATSRHGLWRSNLSESWQQEIKPTVEDVELPQLSSDAQGRLWVAGLGAGLNLISYEGIEEVSNQAIGLPKNLIVKTVFIDTYNHVWVGTENEALFRLDKSQTSMLQYPFSETNPTGISSTYIRTIFEDRENTLWLGTWGGGISLYDENKASFGYVRSSDKPQALSDNFIHAFEQDKQGNIWIGTRNGLNYTTDGCRSFSQPYTDDLSSPYIKALLFDKKDNLWVGTVNGLNLFTEKGTRQFFSTNDSTSISENDITFIHQDEEGQVWVGTWNGLNLFRPETNDFKRFLYNESQNIDHHMILSLVEWRNRFWLGTYDGGLLAFDPETGEYDRYTTANGLTHNRIWTLAKGGNCLWIGTFGGGLHKLTFESDMPAFEVFSESQGLVNNAIIGILIDDQQNLWISTNGGISKFHAEDESFVNFTAANGLQSNHFNVATLKATDGTLYFGGSQGLNHFKPEMIQANARVPITYIDRFELFNKPVAISNESILEESILKGNAIQLSYDQDVISFSFNNSSFKEMAKNKFAYRMQGFDREWVFTGNDRRYVTYTNLPSGDYIFEVKSTNNAGIWSMPTAIDVNILAPWWEQWWARLGAAILIIGGFVGFYNARLNLLKKQKEVLEYNVQKRTKELNEQKDKAVKDKKTIELQAEALRKLDVAKSHFFANISHELRTPITLIKAPLEQIINTENLPDHVLQKLEVAAKNGDRLAVLVEEILDLAKLEAGKMPLYLNPSDLKSLLEDIITRYEAKAIGLGINLSLHYRLTDEDSQRMLDQNKITKVMDNLLSNALKFTTAGDSIEVSAATGGHENLVITVKDTGAGIPQKDVPYIFDRFYQATHKNQKAIGGTGIGLALSSELARLMEGDIRVKSEEGKGSEFTFSFTARRYQKQTEAALVATTEPRGYTKDIEAVIRQYTLHFQIEKPVVVVAEDHPEMRHFIVEMLSPWFNVIAFPDGRQALDFLQIHTVDIIISDMMMPQMDGMELLHHIKNDEALSFNSVVMLTARSADEDKLTALTIGVDDYITKPFNVPELLVRMKNILNNRMRRPLQKIQSSDLSVDQQFILKLKSVIIESIDNSHFSVSYLAAELAISERQLQRKIKFITGLSPRAFVKEVKLQEARKNLLTKKVATVAEAAYSVGYNDPETFTNNFVDRYGTLPSKMIK